MKSIKLKIGEARFWSKMKFVVKNSVLKPSEFGKFFTKTCHIPTGGIWLPARLWRDYVGTYYQVFIQKHKLYSLNSFQLNFWSPEINFWEYWSYQTTPIFPNLQELNF